MTKIFYYKSKFLNVNVGLNKTLKPKMKLWNETMDRENFSFDGNPSDKTSTLNYICILTTQQKHNNNKTLQFQAVFSILKIKFEKE